MRNKMLKLVRVLFASPGDTVAERALAGKVVEEINRIWGERTGVWLKALMWEIDTYSATDQDGQAVINRQLGDDYEAFIGIMRERFGSPTSRHESGTEEEYLRAYGRRQIDPDSVDIGFYFSSAPIPRDHLNPQALQQLQKMRAFRENLRRRGTLDRDYSGTDEFEIRIRLHLSRLMQKWEDRLAPTLQFSPKLEDHEVPSAQPVIANLPPLSEGTLTRDLSVASDRLERANEVRTQIVQAISRFGQQAEARTQSLQDALAAKDPAGIIRVLEEAQSAEARELEEAGDAIGPLVIPFAQYYRGALLSGSRLAAYTAAAKANLAGTRRLADALEALRPQFDALGSALEGWKNSVVATEAGTLEVLRNRQHLLYAVDALLSESKVISSLMSEVASALRGAGQ